MKLIREITHINNDDFLLLSNLLNFLRKIDTIRSKIMRTCKYARRLKAIAVACAVLLACVVKDQKRFINRKHVLVSLYVTIRNCL